MLPGSIRDFKYLSNLISGKYPQHPFKYLLIDFWLTTFIAHNDQYESECLYRTNFSSQKKESALETKCILLLKDGLSMTEITRRTGKSQCYLKLLAAKNRISIEKKPRLITSDIRKLIVVQAKKGFHRHAIAREFELSVGSIEQVISEAPGLVEWRKKCRFESLRRRYKVEIIRAVHGNPNALKQEIKTMHNRAFHWLYRHERCWLNKTLPAPIRSKRVLKVDWAARDTELAKKVPIIMAKQSGCMSRTKLDIELGGHGWLTKMGYRLPTTMKVYQKLSTKSSFESGAD